MVVGLLAIPVLLLAILTQWGALLLLGVGVLVGIGLWVWKRKFLFYEIAAFLIHFDGVGAGPARMGRFVAGIAVLVILYKLFVDRWRPPAIPLRSWAPIWALMTWAMASALWSKEAGSFINSMLMFVLGVIYYCVTSMLVDSHEAVQKFLRAFWVGGLFGSAAGVLGLAIGSRSQGLGGDPNFFGLLQASMIPLTVYYRRHATSPKLKNLYTLALIFVLAGAAGAGSRSGLISGAITIVATMVTRPGLSVGRRSRVAVVAIVVGALAFIVGFVANPNNLARGFADRGAGRLDFYTVTVPLIAEQPITGHGFGQIRLLIPPNLRTTPGSQQTMETREDVSAHNTLLDTTGDLGIVGMLLFVSIFVIAVIGFVRPRWLQLKELSTTLLVMLIPVFSSSMFLPLLNNKLAWCMIGLAAAVQVPSWRSRWPGLAGAGTEVGSELVPAGGSGTGVAAAADPSGALVRGAAAATGAASSSIDGPTPERLAVWDLRLTHRVRRAVVLGAVLSALVAGVIASALPTHYSATIGVFARRMDTSVQPEYVSIDYERMQGVLTLAISGAYAAELQRLSGLDLPVTEIRDRLSVTRPKSGNAVQIVYTDTDEANTRQVMPYLLPALDNIFTASRADAEAQTANEIRPVVPGEQRYYTSSFYTPAYDEAVFAADPPATGWMILTGGATGMLAVLGLALAGMRHPRVESVDDFPRRTGLRLWTHVGGGRSRRLRATAPQFAQVVTTIVDSAVDPTGNTPMPSRLVVTGPSIDADVRRLALGIAAVLVAEGRRVVLVDGDLHRPKLSSRLARRSARGLADLCLTDLSVAEVMRPVSRWRMPAVPRRLLKADPDQLRFVSAGTRRARRRGVLDPTVLDQLDPEVSIVVLSPPTQGTVPVSPLLEWSEATVLTLVEGHTTTEHAEDASSAVRLFSHGSRGIVLVGA